MSLNMIQRKMLDNLYSTEFNNRQKAILDKRSQEFNTLKDKVIKQEMSKKSNKKLLAMATTLFLSRNKLAKNGLAITGISSYDKKPLLELRYSYGDNIHPKLKSYNDRTESIRQGLNAKLQNLRSKVYGLDVTYEEIVSEVDKIFKTL